ncbi:MAG: cobalt ECF transporter T component CbiQ [Anaerolineaceae bacterium]|nr:cobalt ECF transporter T component CbiQ [Anaerolineaceae bacterium]MCB9102022.1 cobalt ECF transporter T component CbiQ [Anaerolineales bacterium]
MHIIDCYAYSNKIRAVDPAQKAGLAVIVLGLCLAFNHPVVSLLAVAWMWGLAVWQAGLPVLVFGRVLLAELFFLALATVAVALSVSLNAPANPDAWLLPVGPLWISSTPDDIFKAANLVLRALGAASAMNFLALTTPLVDLVDLLRRLRFSPILIDLMTVMYRFIFVLMESLNRMYVAQDSRLGYSSYWRGMSSAGLLGSRLFIEAFQRSQRLQTALDARGYEGGHLQVLPTTYYRSDKLLAMSAAAILSLAAAWLVL